MRWILGWTNSWSRFWTLVVCQPANYRGELSSTADYLTHQPTARGGAPSPGSRMRVPLTLITRGRFYCFARLLSLSPDCCRGNMRGWRGHLCCSQASRTGLPASTPTPNRVCSIMLSRQDAGPSFLWATASVRQG